MDEIVRERITVGGIVQGVGFRPFVYRLAHELALTGRIANTIHGVEIEVEGLPENIERFVNALKSDAPPMARVGSIRRRKIEPDGGKKFRIEKSPGGEGRTVPVAPDSAVCEDCLAEMRDSSDRRWRYPFINCTNCGPRYTIITDIPYDRPNTTMAAFRMCPACRTEYENPLDRRFHAQPNACPVCGPRAWLAAPDGAELEIPEGEDPLQVAGRLLRQGRVLAIKGLGGFHLACDSTSEQAVAALRARKRRQGKPFALMLPDLAAVESICRTSKASRIALASPERPIVLLPKRKRPGIGLAQSVSPGMEEHGVMLPYTPLHYLLLQAAGNVPLVMTSGNMSDEPIVIDNKGALSALAAVADFFLLHDRPIRMRNDDSVVRPSGRGVFPVRRSRGFAPRPIRLARKLPPVLAVGGQLKNTVCLVRGRDAFISQHVGDIDGGDSYRYFVDTVGQMLRLFELEPDRVACDMHPAYQSSRWARSQSGLPVVEVQHHHAHIVSCMADNAIAGRVLGVAMDGTGYGPDGTSWGGEFLAADEKEFQRLGHLPLCKLPGGDSAIRYTWRTARSLFGAALGTEKLDGLGLKLWDRAGRKEVDTVDRMITAGVNCPLSSGCGRLFDAVAAITGIRTEALYEGQAAVELEALASRARSARRYDFALAESAGMIVPDLAPMLEAIARDCAAGVEPSAIARGFHDCLVSVIASVCKRLCDASGLNRVVLSGGVFNNRLILEGLAGRLRGLGLRVWSHRELPPGDGGISLGQAIIAANN